MKKLSFIFIIFISITVNSQVIISENPQVEINGSGILELNSKKGFLPPVMTVEERNQIPVSTNSFGLIIYSLTSKSLNIYDGNKWHILKSKYRIQKDKSLTK